MNPPISSLTFTTQGALRKSALRQANERLVLNCIRENPHLSRVEISRVTGLSPSSITFIVKRLTKERLVTEERAGDTAPQVGRPPTILKLAPGARFAVGVDISPNNSRVAVADWTGVIMEEHPVEWHADPESMLRALHAAIRSVVAPRPSRRILGVGVSMPGTWDPASRTITTAVNLGWNDVAVAPILEKGFDIPFYFDNNANLSALGERWFRSQGAKPFENFVFVTLGDGIGTGLIVGGRVLHGAFGRAGEFGHMTLHPDGRKCLCGNIGCWEEYAADRALIRMVEERTGHRHTIHQIEAMALAGDTAILAAVDEAAGYLALGFSSLIVGLNPEAILFDNWAAALWSLIERKVWTVLRERAPAAWLDGVRLQPSAHADNSSLLGAIGFVLTSYFHSFEHGLEGEAANVVQMRG